MNIHKNARLTPWRREELALSAIERRLSQVLRRRPMVCRSEPACEAGRWRRCAGDQPNLASTRDRRRFEENVLLNRSIRQNIALADPAMPMERGSLAGAHDFILELREGYEVSTASLPAPGSPASRLRDMASHRTDTLILEAADASETSSCNSELIHAGITIRSDR